MQIQLWASDAPRWQVAGALVAVAMAVALLAASFVPATDDDTGNASAVIADSPATLSPGAEIGNEGGAAVAGADPGATPNTGGGAVQSAGGSVTTVPTGASAPLTASDRGVTAETVKLGFALLT